MCKNNHKLNCPCAVKDNKHAYSNLFSSLEIRDRCHLRKACSRKELIKCCEEHRGFYHDVLLHVLESFNETKNSKFAQVFCNNESLFVSKLLKDTAANSHEINKIAKQQSDKVANLQEIDKQHSDKKIIQLIPKKLKNGDCQCKHWKSASQERANNEIERKFHKDMHHHKVTIDNSLHDKLNQKHCNKEIKNVSDEHRN